MNEKPMNAFDYLDEQKKRAEEMRKNNPEFDKAMNEQQARTNQWRKEEATETATKVYNRAHDAQETIHQKAQERQEAAFEASKTDGTFHPNSDPYFKGGHKLADPKPAQETPTTNTPSSNESSTKVADINGSVIGTTTLENPDTQTQNTSEPTVSVRKFPSAQERQEAAFEASKTDGTFYPNSDPYFKDGHKLADPKPSQEPQTTNESSKINNHIFSGEASQFGPTAGSYNSGYTDGTFNPNADQYFKDGHKIVNPKSAKEAKAPNRYSGIPDPSLWGTSGTKEKKSTKISNPKNNRGAQNSGDKPIKTPSHLSSKGYLSSTGNFGTISIPKLQNPPTFDEYDHWAGQMAIAMKNVADRIPAVVSDLESNESTVRAGSDGKNVIAIADKVKNSKDNLNKYRSQLVSEADYVVRMARSINDTKANAIQNEIKKTMVDTTSVNNGAPLSDNVKVAVTSGNSERDPAKYHYTVTLHTSDIKAAFDKHGRRPTQEDIESKKAYVKTLVIGKLNSVVAANKSLNRETTYEIKFV